MHGNCMNRHCDWYEEEGDCAMIVQEREREINLVAVATLVLSPSTLSMDELSLVFVVYDWMTPLDKQ